MKLLQGPFTSMLVGGISFLLTMVFLLEKPLMKTSAPPVEESSPVTGFWERHNPEVDQIVEELRREKEVVATREAELRKLSEHLESERAEITTITQRVAQMQAEFDQNVVRLKEEETPNLKKLARMYATMSPESVSSILKEMDDQSVVKLFSVMKEGDSAALLDSMAKQGDVQAKRAASISDLLRKVVTDKRKTP
jgi:flagellar motility protein MotE (MotC chaperone)